MIKNRVYGSDCPICSGKKVIAKNSLAVVNPKIALQWHPTNNSNKFPNQFSKSSSLKFDRMCNKKHIWKSSIKSPVVSLYWDTKRNDTSPIKKSNGSGQIYSCKCLDDKPYDNFTVSIHARTTKTFICPFCNGKRINMTNNLALIKPNIALAWHISSSCCFTEVLNSILSRTLKIIIRFIKSTFYS